LKLDAACLAPQVFDCATVIRPQCCPNILHDVPEGR
jgi:hypothetical protein